MRFNQQVEPSVLDESFEAVDSNGKVLAKEVLSAGRRRVHAVMIELPTERMIEVSLKKGTPGVEGPLGLEKDFITQISLAPAFGCVERQDPMEAGYGREMFSGITLQSKPRPLAGKTVSVPCSQGRRPCGQP